MDTVCVDCGAWSQFLVFIRFCIAMGVSAVTIVTIGGLFYGMIEGVGWIAERWLRKYHDNTTTKKV